MSAAAGQNAAPSSHMSYSGANVAGDILINEVRVPKDGEAMYTFYEALGWAGQAGGYAGIQAHPKAHNYIFSIWDHKSHTAPIRAVYRGSGTRTTPFGGEGTGLKSWNFELGWDTDVWYTLVARCWPVGDDMFYGYWVRSDKTKMWTHMVTMAVAAKDAYFRGSNGSFIEDWVETGQNARSVHLRNGWKRKQTGEWHAFGAARYSVNAWDLAPGKRSFNYRTNWNGGVAQDDGGKFYFMTAGGRKTALTSANPSTHSIARTETAPAYRPITIQSATLTQTSPTTFRAQWKIDPTALPQFSFVITAHAGQAERLVLAQQAEPHARETEFTLPKHAGPTKLQWHLRCRDILDNESAAFPLQVSPLRP